MDRIIISDLKARCIIGVNKVERYRRQEVVINLSLYTDLRKAGRSDRFEDAVDYRAMKKKILKMVKDSRYYLVEALAEAVARLCLEHPAIKEVKVRVDKPSALRFARSVGVQITRRRKN
ncbi:MAG: dihydroneopterin aldolase [bacterium]